MLFWMIDKTRQVSQKALSEQDNHTLRRHVGLSFHRDCVQDKVLVVVYNKFLETRTVLGVPATSRIFTGDSQKPSLSTLTKVPCLIF